jgi:hypothetical protein
MTMPSRRCCLILAAALAGLLPGYASANDRDLKATHISAFDCRDLEASGQPIATSRPRSSGLGVSSLAGARADLVCPLPLNNIDLGGTTNDNDISSFTVFYADADADGRGAGAQLTVALEQTRILNGQFETKVLCSWDSNVHGSTGSSPNASNRPCAVDLLSNGFYNFRVSMRVTQNFGDVDPLNFVGIRFP